MSRSFHQPSHVRVLRPDPSPDESVKRMLTAFVESPWSLTRHEAEVKAFGHTTHTAMFAIDAFKVLKAKGFIAPVERDERRFRATARGVAALQHRLAHDEDEARRHPSGGGAA